MASELTIGKLSKATDVPTSTIRYYERRGLLSPGNRSEGNYRLYDSDAVERLRFIRAAQATGFTLEDVEKLLTLRIGPKTHCEDVQSLMQQRLDDVKQRMKELRHVERVLKTFLDKCQQSSRTGYCQVIEDLNEQTRSPRSPKSRRKRRT